MNHVVARCNGTEIVDRGNEAWVTMKEVPSPAWTMVAGLLASVTVINGALQGIYAAVKGGVQHGFAAVVLLGLGMAFVKAGLSLRRAATEAAEARGQRVLVFANGMLLDGEQRELCSLEDVKLTYELQLASSSKALTLRWPSGSLVIARGSPFGDPVDECVAALEALGLKLA
jgi:hypothetical protein